MCSIISLLLLLINFLTDFIYSIWSILVLNYYSRFCHYSILLYTCMCDIECDIVILYYTCIIIKTDVMFTKTNEKI